MLFSRRKNVTTEEKKNKQVLSVSARSDIVVSLQDVSLGTQIKSLNYEIKKGSWLLLMGPDALTKAIFCDLCFGFVKPDKGRVQPRFSGADVSFLGRPNITYGTSLMDHLTSGVRQRSRDALESVAKEVFGTNLRKFTSKETILRTLDDVPIRELALTEKDLMEIAESNTILQNRDAVIIDTSSTFYQLALQQGFVHSKLLLNSGKTIFWLINDQDELNNQMASWRNQPNVAYFSLHFSLKVPQESIN